MKKIILIFLCCFGLTAYSQESLSVLHNQKELIIKISPFADSIINVDVSGMEINGFLCYGNTLALNKDMVSKNSDTITINLLSKNSTQNIQVNNDEMLKLRILANQGIRYSPHQIVVVLIMINGREVKLVSKYNDDKFCHKKTKKTDSNHIKL